MIVAGGMIRTAVMAACLLAAFCAGARESVPPAPFTMPVRAKVTETAADGKGWMASGEIAVSFEQAKAQFGSKIAAAGWTHLHAIALGRNRMLEAWSRGSEELTLMVWRIAPGRSGFSYGLSCKAKGKTKGKDKEQ